MPALIDTGATHCLFPLGAAEALQLDVTSREGRQVHTFDVSGKPRPAFSEIVTLTLPPFEELNWDAEIWFFFEEWDLPFALLGSEGFLDKWVVSFDRSSNYFIVESPPEFQRRLPRDSFVDFQEFFPDEWQPPA